MRRSVERWRAMVPSAVCAGSPAQVLYCIQDDQHDILELAKRLGALTEELPRAGVCEICGGLLEWEHDHKPDQSGIDDGPSLSGASRRPRIGLTIRSLKDHD